MSALSRLAIGSRAYFTRDLRRLEQAQFQVQGNVARHPRPAGGRRVNCSDNHSTEIDFGNELVIMLARNWQKARTSAVPRALTR
jgi:hypothetical protein